MAKAGSATSPHAPPPVHAAPLPAPQWPEAGGRPRALRRGGSSACKRATTRAAVGTEGPSKDQLWPDAALPAAPRGGAGAVPAPPPCPSNTAANWRGTALLASSSPAKKLCAMQCLGEGGGGRAAGQRLLPHAGRASPSPPVPAAECSWAGACPLYARPSARPACPPCKVYAPAQTRLQATCVGRARRPGCRQRVWTALRGRRRGPRWSWMVFPPPLKPDPGRTWPWFGEEGRGHGASGRAGALLGMRCWLPWGACTELGWLLVRVPCRGGRQGEPQCQESRSWPASGRVHYRGSKGSACFPCHSRAPSPNPACKHASWPTGQPVWVGRWALVVLSGMTAQTGHSWTELWWHAAWARCASLKNQDGTAISSTWPVKMGTTAHKNQHWPSSQLTAAAPAVNARGATCMPLEVHPYHSAAACSAPACECYTKSSNRGGWFTYLQVCQLSLHRPKTRGGEPATTSSPPLPISRCSPSTERVQNWPPEQ